MHIKQNQKTKIYTLLIVLLCFFGVSQVKANELPEAEQSIYPVKEIIPSWHSQKGEMVSPQNAKAILLDQATKKRKRWQLQQEKSNRQRTLAPQSSWQDSLLEFFFSSANAGSTLLAGSNVAYGVEITELARSLKNDPDLIYQYVRNNIAYEPTFGEKKGPVGTLLDQSGNAFDQSALMIELLRASGFEANYVFGVVNLDFNEYKDWLGAETALEGAQFLANGGIPVVLFTDDSIEIDHVWVKVSIDGSSYVFDPSIKSHLNKKPVDLGSVIGFSDSSFMGAALSGSTQTTNSIQNANQLSIETTLSSYTDSLISHIKSISPRPTLEDIIGGQIIIPSSVQLRQASLPYQSSISDEWLSEIPIDYSTTLDLSVAGISEMFRTSEIYGRRLTLFFNGGNFPELRLDGQLLATGIAVAPGNTTITFDIDHPYAAISGTYMDVNNGDQSLEVGGNYFIVNSWGNVGTGIIDKRRKWLENYRYQGDGAYSETLLGESLALI